MVAEGGRYPILLPDIRVFSGTHVASVFSTESARTVAFCNETALELLASCDGSTSVEKLISKSEVSRSYLTRILTSMEKNGVLVFSDRPLIIDVDRQVHTSLIPWSAQIEITRNCQLRCRYCFNSSGRQRGTELTAEQWIRIIDLLSGMGLTSVSLTGGEPFTKPGFFSILDHCIRNVECVTVFTNGIFLGDRWPSLTQNEISTLQRAKRFQVSVDSTTERIHDRYRGEGSWEKAVNAITLLKNIDCNVRISTTLHNENIDQYKQMIDWAKNELDVDITLGLMDFQGRSVRNGFEELVVEDETKIPEEHLVLNSMDRCAPLRGQIYISSEGHLLPCPKNELAFDLWFESSEQGARYQSLIDQLSDFQNSCLMGKITIPYYEKPRFDECQSCEYCLEYCKGCNLAPYYMAKHAKCAARDNVDRYNRVVSESP